jgi:stress response protein YsnF
MSADERSGMRSADARTADAEQVVDHQTVAVVPLVEERLVVSKRSVEGERVRVRVVTDEVAELARVSLRSERIEVERVPIGRAVETAPPVREEDGATVIPILEEIVVVEKRLILKEELRVRRVPSTRHEEQPVTLRRQRAEIERLPPASAGGPTGAIPPKGGEHI